MSAFEEDVEDIQVVVEYLMRELGYIVDLLIGHSKGSVAGMRWLITAEEGKLVPWKSLDNARKEVSDLKDTLKQKDLRLLRLQQVRSLRDYIALCSSYR